MVTALSRKARLTLVLMGSLVALSLGLVSSAQAATSTYCTGWLGGNQACAGAGRTLYQTYGWGDQYPACVAIEAGWAISCAPSAGTGVYSQRLATPRWSKPLIVNGNLNTPNFVHGIALQP